MPRIVNERRFPKEARPGELLVGEAAFLVPRVILGIEMGRGLPARVGAGGIGMAVGVAAFGIALPVTALVLGRLVHSSILHKENKRLIHNKRLSEDSKDSSLLFELM